MGTDYNTSSTLNSASRLHRVRGDMALVLCAGLVCCVQVGCGAGQVRAKKVNTDEPVNTSLGKIGSNPDLALPRNEDLMERGEYGSVSEQIEESARQLSVYFTNLEIDGVKDYPVESEQVQEDQPIELEPKPKPVVAEVSTPLNTSSSTTNGDGGVRVSLLGASQGDASIESEALTIDSTTDAPVLVKDTQSKSDVGDVPSVNTEAVDPVARKEELARELASILADLASTSDDPGSAALALASLEMILPNDGGALVDEGVLSDAELASLEATRAFLRSMSSAGSIASPAQVSTELESIKAQLDAWAGLTIKKAALCTHVEGYGRYETFSSYRFVAGRAQPVIVYVELERFAQREVVGPDGQARFETKLSQRLELYHVADDLNTWNRAAELVTDETRNRLRDYYLTNKVTLPANLGVGRYHLKVVMRDLIGERVSETIIPIEIVAR